MDIQIQFLLQNGHFALNLFVALVFFAAFWLFYDAWTIQKDKKNILKSFGFFFLFLSFTFHSTQVEQISLSQQFELANIFILLTTVFKLVGFLLLICGLILDPIQKKPEVKDPYLQTPAIFVMSVSLTKYLSLLFFSLSTLVGVLFFIRATKGLERHLRPVAISFFVLSLSELLSFSENFRQSSNVATSQLTAVFGPLWILRDVLLLIAGAILGKWI